MCLFVEVFSPTLLIDNARRRRVTGPLFVNRKHMDNVHQMSLKIFFGGFLLLEVFSHPPMSIKAVTVQRRADSE